MFGIQSPHEENAQEDQRKEAGGEGRHETGREARGKDLDEAGPEEGGLGGLHATARPGHGLGAVPLPCAVSNLVRQNGARETLQRELTHGRGVDKGLDVRVDKT